VKGRKIVGDDSINERRLDLGASGINPFIHFMCQRAEFVIDDHAVSCVYVLHAGHEDSFIVHLGDRVLALFEATETDLPSSSVRFVRVSNEVLKAVIKEGTERRNSGREEFEGVSFVG